MGVIEFFWPTVRGEREPAPPGEQSATISDVTLVKNTSFRQYLESVDSESGGLSDEVLARRVAVVSYRLKAVGVKGDSLTMKLELIRARDLEEIAESKAHVFRIQQHQETFRFRHSMTLPSDAGQYWIRLSVIREGDVTPLDEKQSALFPGLSRAPPP